MILAAAANASTSAPSPGPRPASSPAWHEACLLVEVRAARPRRRAGLDHLLLGLRALARVASDGLPPPVPRHPGAGVAAAGVGGHGVFGLRGGVASLGGGAPGCLSRDGQPRKWVNPARHFVLVADVCASVSRRGRRRGRLGVGVRALTHPQAFACWRCAALGEALRGAGVPTPHAELRPADVTLSPRRPRSCGQR